MCDETESLIESLLDEFVDCLRRGENPSIAEYEAAHPECAGQIREFFPAALMVEQIARRRQHEPPRPPAPERLGDYRIIREIGRGGMGIVYEAEQESLSRHVAVKVLPQSTLLSPNSLRRFQREGRIAARLHHTNIVPVFGVGQDQGFDYIVMPLIRGVGLDKILFELARNYAIDRPSREPQCVADAADDVSAVARAIVAGDFLPLRPSSGSISDSIETSSVGERAGPLPTISTDKEPKTAAEPIAAPSSLGSEYWQSVARIGVQAIRALQYAHGRGTLHRDIKPANLLLDLQGIVWVSDFGLAKAMEQDEMSQTGDIVGTLRYMAPERFSGKTDARSDIYSLGLTLYEMLTLRPAYEHSHPSDLVRRITAEQPPRPRAINPQIPRDLETIVLKAIAREPDHRYRSAGELADDLERFLDDRPIRARRVGLPERLWRWSRRNRAIAALTGLAVALLILVVVVATVGYVRTRIANQQVNDALAGESQQRSIAETQRQKAETMSELTLAALDDIFEQFVPSQIGRTSELAFDDTTGGEIRIPVQPVLSKEAAALLDRMLTFYDRLAAQDASDARLRAKVADANRRVGIIRRRLGQFEQAQAAYLRAIETYRSLEQVSPDNPAIETEIARIHNDLGDLCWTARWEGQGRAFHLKALEILQTALATQPSQPQSHFELAQTYYFLGRGGPPDKAPAPRPPADDQPPLPKLDRRSPPSRGTAEGDRPPPADRDQQANEENLQQAIQILEGLSSEHPLNPDYRHLLACCYRELPQARPESALQSPFGSTDKAIEILRKLVDDFPNVPDYRYDLSKTYAKIDFHDPTFNARSYPAAENRLRQALSISEKLIAEHPNVPDYAAAEVQILYTLSEVLRHTRRPEDVETTLRSALTLQASLVEQFPKAAPYQSWKAIIQDSLAKMLANRGQTREARSLLESAVEALEAVLQNNPQAGYIHDVLGRCYQNYAEVLTQMGEEQQAAEMLLRGREHRGNR
jgi:eukaryotic-like serine/threonine-protein kinase